MKNQVIETKWSEIIFELFEKILAIGLNVYTALIMFNFILYRIEYAYYTTDNIKPKMAQEVMTERLNFAESNSYISFLYDLPGILKFVILTFNVIYLISKLISFSEELKRCIKNF